MVVLRSGRARIGTDGVAGTFGKAGTPNFKSMSRSLAGTGMLPQGRLAGEHVRCTNHFGTPEVVGSHLFLVIGLEFETTETIMAQVRSINAYWFPHCSGADIPVKALESLAGDHFASGSQVPFGGNG